MHRERGAYSGALGFIGYTGTADLGITIRTAVSHDGELTIGAGGAIVLDSDAAAEYDEMLLKAEATLRALPKARVPGSWTPRPGGRLDRWPPAQRAACRSRSCRGRPEPSRAGGPLMPRARPELSWPPPGARGASFGPVWCQVVRLTRAWPEGRSATKARRKAVSCPVSCVWARASMDR
ncbi:chorismate-binding protein [Streptomyces sp. NPDC002018]|uniref:chorismate-binding protein n=1 Tax=Streptomyces sp. NPDC002018 TaxID=3364629 RepID=UPI00367D8BB9